MIYTEYQQVLLTQLQNNDKRIEEIKKEKEKIGYRLVTAVIMCFSVLIYMNKPATGRYFQRHCFRVFLVQLLYLCFQFSFKRIEEIKKEKEEIQEMFLQESKFKPGDLIQIDYKISNATFKVRGWIFRITFWRNRPYYHLNLPKKDGSRGLRVKSVCDGVLESITSISHIKLDDLKGGAK